MNMLQYLEQTTEIIHTPHKFTLHTSCINCIFSVVHSVYVVGGDIHITRTRFAYYTICKLYPNNNINMQTYISLLLQHYITRTTQRASFFTHNSLTLHLRLIIVCMIIIIHRHMLNFESCICVITLLVCVVCFVLLFVWMFVVMIVWIIQLTKCDFH
jgi:hypothetical protein